MIRRSILFAALCLLAACENTDTPDTAPGEEGELSGDVLEGTISDEMLPLDTLRSQSSPAEVVEEEEEPDASAQAG
ncbi:MAG: hypothetical protein V2J51_15270 [Erythrobacter sp.]|jgi:hypothetical protein|nr:hypothetical protein [Erythrobacter sp.]